MDHQLAPPVVRRPRRRRVAVYLLVVVPVVLGLAEAATRLFGLAPGLPRQYAENVTDPHLPFKRRPNSVLRGRSRSGEFEFEYRHNSLGFRDVERSLAKPPDTYRIVALGDSFTYGAGADFEETYVSQLQQLLEDESIAGKRVELINLGLPRYFPAAERLVLEHYGLAFEPDLVLVAFLPNDVLDTYLGLEQLVVTDQGYLGSRDGLGPTGRWFYLHSHVARVVLHRWSRYKQRRDRPVHPREVYEPEGFHEEDWRSLEGEYERMLGLAREAGAELLLLSIPQKGPWNESRRYPDRRLAAWAEDHDVQFVPALPALEAAATGRTLYWERDGHCNAEGYGVIAAALRSSLRQSGLLDD